MWMSEKGVLFVNNFHHMSIHRCKWKRRIERSFTHSNRLKQKVLNAKIVIGMFNGPYHCSMAKVSTRDQEELQGMRRKV